MVVLLIIPKKISMKDEEDKSHHPIY